MTKCIGCGAYLQSNNPNELGYVQEPNQDLCMRCFKLTNYGEYQQVSLNNKYFNKIINNIPNTSLVVYLSDILTLNLDNINKFNKVILVITKRDILPKSIKDTKIITSLKNKYPNLIDIIIISTKKNYNIDYLYNSLNKYSNNKPIYFIGQTNTGKSTLLNKLIKNYSNNSYHITTSPYPSTTLDKVEISLNNLNIIDTPGILDYNNINNYISNKDLKKINITKEIKPKTCQIKGNGSILIDNYARIDYNTNTNNSIVIYASNNLNIRFNSLANNKLKDLPIHKYKLNKNKDIIIPGLCFIKITHPINIDIYTINNVKPLVRDNLI